MIPLARRDEQAVHVAANPLVDRPTIRCQLATARNAFEPGRIAAETADEAEADGGRRERLEVAGALRECNCLHGDVPGRRMPGTECEERRPPGGCGRVLLRIARLLQRHHGMCRSAVGILPAAGEPVGTAELHE